LVRVFQCPRWIASLARSGVPRLAFVSCNPSTFARAAAALGEGGYRLDRIRLVGQFRWSAHVEPAAAVSRDGPGPRSSDVGAEHPDRLDDETDQGDRRQGEKQEAVQDDVDRDLDEAVGDPQGDIGPGEPDIDPDAAALE